MPATTSELTLPEKAHHPDNENHPGGDVGDGPPIISGVEQKMRVDLGLGGAEHGMDFVGATIARQKRYEENEVFLVNEMERRLAKADPYLQAKLGELLEEEEDEWSRRAYWYTNMESEVRDKFNRALDMVRISNGDPYEHGNTAPSDTIEFEVYTVVEKRSDADEMAPSKNPMAVADLGGAYEPQDFGFDLPQKLVIGQSPSSGKYYPLTPWYGVVICNCGYKDNPTGTLCKHEIAALLKEAQDGFNPDGPSIPARFKRLYHPKVYQNHTPRESVR